MSNIVEFLSRKQLQSVQDLPNAQPTAARDAEIQQLLVRELEKMIKAASFLEALRARLSEEIHSGSHTILADDASSTSGDPAEIRNARQLPSTAEMNGSAIALLAH